MSAEAECQQCGNFPVPTGSPVAELIEHTEAERDALKERCERLKAALRMIERTGEGPCATCGDDAHSPNCPSRIAAAALSGGSALTAEEPSQ